MRFTDRLERELVEAARRHERQPRLLRLLRGAGVPARRPAVPAIGMAAVALLTAVGVTVALRAGGGDREQAVAPPSVFGTWATPTPWGEVRLTLVRGGFLLAGSGIHINGTLRVTADRLRLVRPSGNRVPDAVGGEHVSTLGLPPDTPPLQKRDCTLARSAVYRWQLAGERLQLELVRDPCVVRTRALDGATLRRVSG